MERRGENGRHGRERDKRETGGGRPEEGTREPGREMGKTVSRSQGSIGENQKPEEGDAGEFFAQYRTGRSACRYTIHTCREVDRYRHRTEKE